MTITVTIENHEAGQTVAAQIVLTDPAIKLARLKFNPSGDDTVNRIKAIAAAFYTEMDALIQHANATTLQKDIAVNAAVIGREAAIAKTQMQGAAMFAVSAATAHLV